MSIHDYEISQEIERRGYPFYALIMAAYRQADTLNQQILEGSWPRVIAELKGRYHAPGGILPGEPNPQEDDTDARV